VTVWLLVVAKSQSTVTVNGLAISRRKSAAIWRGATSCCWSMKMMRRYAEWSRWLTACWLSPSSRPITSCFLLAQ
jgi:hypothetical protein